MKNLFVFVAIFLHASTAIAEQTVTLMWPADTRSGDTYYAQLTGLEEEVVGQYLLTVTPNDSIIVPADEGANICFWPNVGAKSITALHGIYFNNPIALVPDRSTGKTCLSLFDNKSTEWNVAF